MKKKLIIFDLDGTLYELRGGTYKKSTLRKRVLRNARDFIADRSGETKKNAQSILEEIQKKYGEEISIGLEKEHGLDRYDYFNTVWDIPARTVVRKTTATRKALMALKGKYRLALVSDAPKVWINNVLKELKVKDLFSNNIYSGEGNRRKGFGNAFNRIIKDYKISPKDCIAVGDQENTDIIPAKKLGMLTVYVGRFNNSSQADIGIKAINMLPAKLNRYYTNKKP